MARIKRGNNRIKRRNNVLKRAKGFLNARSTHLRAAREALLHAESHAYTDRRRKKRNMRSLWITRLSIAVKERGMSYSEFIDRTTKANIKVNRKMLSELSIKNPEILEKIISQI